MTGRLDNCIVLPEPNIDFLKDETIIKILFQNNDRQYLETIEREMTKETLSQFSISYSGNRYIEFNSQGVSKGNALLQLAKELGINQDEMISIGDNNNDISMLEVAGLGIAVANATTDAKEAAKVVSEYTNNQSAIAQVIEQYVLN